MLENFEVYSKKPMPYGGGMTKDYNWIRLLRKDRLLSKSTAPALFLDRDGVVNVENGYILSYKDIIINDGIAKIINYFNKKSYPVIIITNQAAIGRGILSWADYWQIEDEVIQSLAAQGAFIDLIVACTHHNEAPAPFNDGNNGFRKPNSGMLTFAADLLKLDLQVSTLIGDMQRDIMAAYNAGLRQAYFINSGHEQGTKEWHNANENDFLPMKLKKAANLHEIYEHIITSKPAYFG